MLKQTVGDLIFYRSLVVTVKKISGMYSNSANSFLLTNFRNVIESKLSISNERCESILAPVISSYSQGNQRDAMLLRAVLLHSKSINNF